MKAIIKSARFDKEIETKFGIAYIHKIEYDDKKATYFSTAKDQTKFIAGKEAEFTEEKKGNYLNIKPIQKAQFSPYNRAVKKEQSKYSGFAMSYAKDLVCEGKIKPDQMFATAKKMMDWMVLQDKEISQ